MAVMYGRPPLGKGFFGVSASGSGAVMYPAFMHGAVTAGPDGVRWLGSNHSGALVTRNDVSECPTPVSDRFAFTPYLPFPILGPQARSTNSNPGFDHRGINKHPVGSPSCYPPRQRWCELRRPPARPHCDFDWAR